MDDRSWYLAIGSLAAGVVGMFLDAAITKFNLDPGFYPFLGILAGGALGRTIWKGRNKEGDK